MAYFDHIDFISNSDLTALEQQLMGYEEIANLQQVFDFGNLVDAYISEEASVAKYEALHDNEQIQKAQLMTEAYHSDPAVQRMFPSPIFQKEYYRKAHKVFYDGFELRVKAKCKFDLFQRMPGGDLGGDIKTTHATSQKQFVESIEYFNYDRAAAWYLDLAGIDRTIFIGISKKRNPRTQKHDVFKFPVVRGDETYKRGLEKYSRLAWKYHFTITNLLIQCKRTNSLMTEPFI